MKQRRQSYLTQTRSSNSPQSYDFLSRGRLRKPAPCLPRALSGAHSTGATRSVPQVVLLFRVPIFLFVLAILLLAQLLLSDVLIFGILAYAVVLGAILSADALADVLFIISSDGVITPSLLPST